jgi:hypothetical protein
MQMLDKVIGKAKARARERCEACGQQEAIAAVGFFFVGQTKCRQVNDPHTCYGDLEVVRGCMEAASRRRMVFPYTWNGQEEADAEIRRLLPEGSGEPLVYAMNWEILAPILAGIGTVFGSAAGYLFRRKKAQRDAEQSMSTTICNLAGSVEDLTNTLHNDLPHIEDEIRKIKKLQGRTVDHLIRLRDRVSALEKRAAAADEQLPPTE